MNTGSCLCGESPIGDLVVFNCREKNIVKPGGFSHKLMPDFSEPITALELHECSFISILLPRLLSLH